MRWPDDRREYDATSATYQSSVRHRTAPRPSCREHTPLLSVEGEVRVATATEPAKLFGDCATCEKTDGNPITRFVSCGQAIVHPIQVLEKRFNRIYTSGRLNESRVLKPHREADGADGSVQRASIKNWRRPIVSIFFFATFDTRLNVKRLTYIWPSYRPHEVHE